jgi:hypothetical protein
VVAIAPSAAAQDSGFGEIRFARVVFTVGPEAVHVAAEGMAVQGQSAADWRECMDGGECPIRDLEALVGGNEDGNVGGDEVKDFEETLLLGVNSVAEFRNYRDTLKVLVRVDGKSASTMIFTMIDLKGAEGPVTSTSPFTVDVGLEGAFQAAEADTHTVAFERTESELTLTDRIVIQAAGGWKLLDASVEPASMQSLVRDGRLEGDQEDFEGTEPLTFEIEKASGVGAWIWIVGGLLVAALAAVAGVIIWQRQKA